MQLALCSDCLFSEKVQSMCFKNTSEFYIETSGIFMGVTTSRSKKDLQVNRDLPKSRKVVCSGLCWGTFRTIFLGE